MQIAEIILSYVKAMIWPITVLVICWHFRIEIKAILARIKGADIFGAKIDMAEKIQEAKALSVEAKKIPPPENKKKGPAIPLTEANARMIKLGLRPSPSGLDMSYYLALAEQDPTIALAGLGIEVDILARNLAKGFNIQVSEKDSGIRLIRKLYDNGAITEIQMQLTMKVIQVRNAVVHGTPIAYSEAANIIETAKVLAEQYLDWLSWGFEDGWHPGTGKKE